MISSDTSILRRGAVEPGTRAASTIGCCAEASGLVAPAQVDATGAQRRHLETAQADLATTSRVAWVDIAKGIGILLVVYGHVARGLVDAGIQPRQGVPVAAASLIYLFHMPLFFALAGLWAPRAAGRPLSRFLSDKAGTILYPYLVWSLIQLGVNAGMGRFTNSAPSPTQVLGIVTHPYAQFWFLYVLFIDLTFAVLLLRFRFGVVTALVIGEVLYITHPLLENGTWPPAVDVARTFLYVAAGAAVAPWVVRRGLAQHPWATRATALTATGLLLLLFVGLGDANPIAGPIMAGLGIIAVATSAQVLAGTPVGGVLERLGNRSLEIYVAHVLGAAGMRVVLSKVFGVSNSGVHLVLDCAAGVAFPLALCWLAQKWRLPWLFTLRLGARSC